MYLTLLMVCSLICGEISVVLPVVTCFGGVFVISNGMSVASGWIMYVGFELVDPPWLGEGEFEGLCFSYTIVRKEFIDITCIQF